MTYYIVYFLTKFVSFFLFPRKVYGWEHIPRQGGFIIASNHVSNMDPVVLGISCLRRINFVAKAELFEKQPLKYILPKLGAFPIKREAADLSALKETLSRLKKSNPVLVFVEGTRRIGNAVPKAQSGVGFLAAKSGLPVIPVYVNGTQNVMPPRSKKLHRKPVTVRFGPPVKLDLTKDYKDIAQTILDAIYRIPAGSENASR
jgi:1-acyl-sn-glycerol-3-phosphate acyltransferase